MVLIGKVDLIGQKWLYSGESSCIRAKWLYSGEVVVIPAKVVVLRQKLLCSGESG